MALALGVPLTLSVGIKAMNDGTAPEEAGIRTPGRGMAHPVVAGVPDGGARP
jgi:hypothetical protein